MAIVFVEEKIVEDECIHHIIDNLYLGNCNARKYINNYNIKKIIEIGEYQEINNYLDVNNVGKLTIILSDNRNSDIQKYFDDIWNFIRKDDNNILIHCKVGTSRSVAFVISYLIKYKNMDLNSALNFIKTIRNDKIYTHPNIGFIKVLRKLEKN